MTHLKIQTSHTIVNFSLFLNILHSHTIKFDKTVKLVTEVLVEQILKVILFPLNFLFFFFLRGEKELAEQRIMRICQMKERFEIEPPILLVGVCQVTF